MDFAHETTGDLPHQTRDLAHKTGDLAYKTGDLADKTSDFANKTGDLAHETGDLADKTGDLVHTLIRQGTSLIRQVTSLIRQGTSLIRHWTSLIRSTWPFQWTNHTTLAIILGLKSALGELVYGNTVMEGGSGEDDRACLAPCRLVLDIGIRRCLRIDANTFLPCT